MRAGAILVHVLFSGCGVFLLLFLWVLFVFPLIKFESLHCTHGLEGLGNALLTVSTRSGVEWASSLDSQTRGAEGALQHSQRARL